MEWISNTYDPNAPDTFFYIGASKMSGQTQEEAYENWIKWLEDKILGEPKATEIYTVEELKGRNMVGVYKL